MTSSIAGNSDLPAHLAEDVVHGTPFNTCRALYVGTGGDVSVVMASGTVIFQNVVSGTILPIRATDVTIANTTASDIIALW